MSKTQSFCGFCGSPFMALEKWPRQCSSNLCGELTWANPTPVGVLLVRVTPSERYGTGILVVQRNIEPAKGQYALPGGFMELGETWQEACSRELREETTIEIAPSEIDLFDCHSVEKGLRVIVFGITKNEVSVDIDDINKRRMPNNEVQSLDVIRTATLLAFATHTTVVDKFFGR